MSYRERLFQYTPTVHTDTYAGISNANHSGRTVLITGASKGIGKAAAVSFARAGASTIIIAARSPLDDAEAAVKAASGASTQVIKLQLDVSSEASVDAAVAKVRQSTSSIDILVNNAGYLEKFTPLGDSSPSSWWTSWETNIRGVYLVTRAFLPLVLESELKIVLNVSSIGALRSRPGASAYQTTKFALLRLTEFLNVEYEDQGLLPLVIHPGGVATELALNMPKETHSVLNCTPELAGDTISWLTEERRKWLAARYVSVNWDMQELTGMRDEIVAEDKLKMRLVL